jgi:NAD(P)-dependent dehydrogenase (short-subunit alcohol dehydrogenase family)
LTQPGQPWYFYSDRYIARHNRKAHVNRPESRPVAFITGGTSGIGLATAQVLHAEGYAVLVTGQSPENLKKARNILPDDVMVVRADARSIADAEEVATELKDRFGKVDVAFLNAGSGVVGPIDTIDEAGYDLTFDVSVKGQVFTLQKILPLLGKGSVVIFNSAMGAHRGLPGWAVYSAAKGALLPLTRALAIELAPRGIRVNAVTPGTIETPAVHKLIGKDQMAGFRERINATVPLGRFGAGEDIARAVAFLASPAASFITGTEIVIDGGQTVGVPS